MNNLTNRAKATAIQSCTAVACPDIVSRRMRPGSSRGCGRQDAAASNTRPDIERWGEILLEHEFNYQFDADRMCCPCKEILKFFIIFFNTLLGFGFLFLALFGVIMLTAPEFLRKVIDWFLYQFAVDVELTAITTFIKDNFSNLSMAFITVGLVFACIAFIGAFASCCECTIVLGVYTALLGVFLVLQSLLLAVILIDKNLYMRAVTDSLSGLIRDYGSETGVATAIWSAIMREVNNKRCCGMDSSRDFIYSRLPTGICPKECCPWSYPQRCHCSEAQAQGMPGCRDRITTFVQENMQVITHILATVLGLQALLFVLTTWQLCANKCG